MKQRGRPFDRADDDRLRRLWASLLSDQELAAAVERHRSVVRRRAAEIGLPTSRRALWSQQAREALATASRGARDGRQLPPHTR
jgi:hypothetical protein